MRIPITSTGSVSDEADGDARITDFDAACLRAGVRGTSQGAFRQVTSLVFNETLRQKDSW